MILASRRLFEATWRKRQDASHDRSGLGSGQSKAETCVPWARATLNRPEESKAANPLGQAGPFRTGSSGKS